MTRMIPASLPGMDWAEALGGEFWSPRVRVVGSLRALSRERSLLEPETRLTEVGRPILTAPGV